MTSIDALMGRGGGGGGGGYKLQQVQRMLDFS